MGSRTHGAVLTEKSNLETMVSEDKDKEAAEKVKLDGINRAKAKSQADLAEASGVLAAKTADADTRETNNALKEKELTDQTKDHTEQVKVKEDRLGGLKTELDTLKAELQKQKDILATKKRDATKAQGDASRADVAAKNAETRELSRQPPPTSRRPSWMSTKTRPRPRRSVVWRREQRPMWWWQRRSHQATK